MALTPEQLKAKIDLLWTRNGSDRISSADLRTIAYDIAEALGAAEVSAIIPTWAAGLTFNTDGTGDGEFTRHADTSGNIRIFQTKTDGNIGNEPPTDPNTTENTHWVEISASSGSAFVEWAAGIYGAGLVIVYYSANFYILTQGVRPFNSTTPPDVDTGNWQQITNVSGGGGEGVLAPVANIAAVQALDTTVAEDYPDKWMILVEDTGSGDGSWYRFDREYADAESLPNIILPGAGPGGFISDTEVKLSGKVDKAAVNGSTFTGAMNLTHIQGTYYSDYNLSLGSPTISIASSEIFGWAYVRIIADGTTVITLDAAINQTYNFPEDGILPVGTHEVYVLKTPAGATLSIPTNVIQQGDSPPVASNVVLSGTEQVGQTLSLTYDYSDADSDPEVGTTFKWYRADDAIGTNEAEIAGATSNTYMLVAADDGKYIRAGVTPANAVDTGSEAFSSYTGAIATGAQLGTPLNFQAVATSTTEINLTWDDNESIDNWVVERALDAGFTTGAVVLDSNRTVNSYQDSGLTDATTYYYRVKAQKAGYTDSLYATDNATTGSLDLAAPTNYALQVVNDDQINHTFDAVTNADNYIIQRAEISDYSDATQVYSGSALSYQDTGLTASTTYYYRLKAQGAGFNDSAWVNLSETTLAGDTVAPIPTFSFEDQSVLKALTTEIYVDFNEAILNTNGTEVTDLNVDNLITFDNVTDTLSVAFTATINAGKNRITIIPDSNLLAIKEYDIVVNNFEDAAGNEETTGVAVNFNTSPDLFLNTFALTPTTAYSTTRLNNLYAGPCLRMVNVGTLAEKDFYFNASGLIDQTEVNAFLGAAAPFITKWYDQTGGGNDLERTAGSFSYCPQLDFSTLTLPSIAFFEPSKNMLKLLSNISQPFTVAMSVDVVDGATNTYLYDYGQNGVGAERCYHLVQNSNDKDAIGAGTNVFTAGTFPYGYRTVIDVFDATDRSYVDNVQHISGNAGSNTFTGVTVGGTPSQVATARYTSFMVFDSGMTDTNDRQDYQDEFAL